MLDAVTIDQLRMLVAVVDAGSFTAAAKQVQRAQSAVSQAIQTLEFQLDLKLFDRSTRRPQLTPEGAAIVADARTVIDRAQALRTKARALAGGVEANVTLALSMLSPMDAVTDVLERFDETFEATNLDLLIQEASGPMEMVVEGRADLGVVGSFNMRGDGVEQLASERLGAIAIAAVAAPGHALAARKGTLSPADTREQRQLVSASARGTGTANPLSLRTWAVADQSVRRVLLKRGFGWAIMPVHVVEADIDDGSLVTLDLESLRGDALAETLLAVHRADEPPGPAGRWLIDTLRQRLGS